MNTRIRIFNIIATVIAVSAGLVTLAAYFIPVDLLVALRLALVSLVSLLAAWAVLAGALNLLIVHSRKFANQAPGGLYSLLVVLGFLAVLAGNLAAPFLGWGSGATNAANDWFVTYALTAGGAALAALIAFFLVYAGYRLLRLKRGGPPSLMVVVFVVSAVLAMIALAPWPDGAPNPTVLGGTTLRDLLRALTRVPAIAGARGLLLGIALGAVATGLRLLMGLDRPYGD
jgi:hypothetical protein